MAIVGILAAVAAMEGIMAVLEHVQGDPEADVQAALAALARKNQRRAFALEAGEVLAQEDLDERFGSFNKVASRTLTQASLLQSPAGPRAGVEPSTALLDFVTQRMGVSPERLRHSSAPRRIGDMSGVQRAINKVPSGTQ